MVATFYLWRRSKTIAFLAIPALIMLLLPGLAMGYNLFRVWGPSGNWLLSGFAIGILGLQIWIVVEAAIVWRKARSVLEPQLAPLPQANT